MSKTSILLISSCLIPLIIGIGSFNPHQALIQNTHDVNILTLIADGIGNTYFTVKDQFEEWGWNVTTAGLTNNHTGCPNKDPIVIPSDILISEIDNISQYDCVFIASGAQHHILRDDQSVLDFINTSYNEGLVISTLCVSTVILADADIINGIKVVGAPLYYNDIVEAGGIFELQAEVVSDGRIITGGRGGGPTGGGDLAAPTSELCVAIAKELLGYSYVLNTSLTPVSGVFKTIFMISVETTNLTNLPLNMNSSGISQVSVDIYRIHENLTLVEEVELISSNNIYLGNFTDMEIGEYIIIIEVINEDECIEVVRNAAGFSIESIVPTTTSQNISLSSQTNSSKSTTGLTFLSCLGIIFYSTIHFKKKDRKSE